jgi:hypothetical protein
MNPKQRTTSHTTIESAIEEELDNIFNTAHANVMTIVTVQEDCLFFIDHHSVRKGFMIEADYVCLLTTKEECSRKEQFMKKKNAVLNKYKIGNRA